MPRQDRTHPSSERLRKVTEGGRGVITQSRDTATAPTADRPNGAANSAELHAARSGLVMLFPRREDEPPDVWPIGGASTLGRSRQAAIRLNDSGISGLHATIQSRPSGLFIRDEGSRHGTFIDGVSIGTEGALARTGSVLRFGDTLLLVVEDVERYRMRPRRTEGAALGLSQTMLAGPTLAGIWDQAARAACLSDPVLILGPSGSGKEFIARILHAGREKPGPFVAINVAAIPDALFEAELFGHERGAFTGASVARAGAFREASGGVLFLDEVGDLKLELQSKLLRALDRQQVRPVGASRDVPVLSRIVSATSTNLDEMRETGTFRNDLYYRLSAIVIHVPPLRTRPDDVILLTLEFLRERTPRLRLSVDAAEILARGRWQGNARQLHHVVLQAANTALAASDTEIRPQHLPELALLGTDSAELSLEQIRSAMKHSGGVAAHAAQALGISRTTLYNALKRFKVNTKSLRNP